jgi:hypothetical protein
MNIPALILALIGIALFVAAYKIGGKMDNRLIGGLIQIVGVIVAIVIPSALASDTATSAQAGTYMVFIGVALVILKLLFFKTKA